MFLAVVLPLEQTRFPEEAGTVETSIAAQRKIWRGRYARRYAGAAFMLTMIQKIFYGAQSALVQSRTLVRDVKPREHATTVWPLAPHPCLSKQTKLRTAAFRFRPVLFARSHFLFHPVKEFP